MSVISNRHTVVPFIAGKTVAFPEQRLSKVGYKETKKTKAKYPSIAVSVPVLADSDISAKIEQLIPHVRSMLENAQDGIVRSLYESGNGVLSSVSDEELSVDMCIQFLDAEATGGRLTKEAIESWFVSSLADNLFVMVAEKLGFAEPNEDQGKVIGQHVNAYKGVMSSLAGGKTFLQPAQIKGCKAALSLVDDADDEMARRLLKRLEQMEQPVKIVELLGLD
jgi:hypothetical protein